MIKATESVNLEELAPSFVKTIKDIEEILCEELIVTSGYRSPDHPIEARKKTPGEHASGHAIDVAAVGGTKTLEIVRAALGAGIERIGINRHKNFVHIGSSELRTKSIWTYDK